MFVGQFEHVLDDKGRLVLPPSYRSRLSEGGVLGKYENCLALWTSGAFEEFVMRLRQRVEAREVRASALRAAHASADEVRPDSQGRITISQRLREYAELDRDVVLAGNYDHIELWSKDRWAELSEDADASLAEAVGLGI